MPWKPAAPGEIPSLGPDILGWIEHYLAVPDGPLAGEPLTFTREQAQFVVNFYAVDPFTGKRRVRRAVYSRPKGSGKSPMMAALMLAEALADVVPAGWDADGRPVARPWWSLGFKPRVQVAAVSEDQTANTWEPLLDMARSSPRLRADYDIEPLESFVNVPRGRIDFVTSQAASREGFRPVFTVMDQTESWLASNGGRRLAATIRRNATKLGGSTVETPNAFQVGMESVAEKSWDAWRAQVEGRTRGDGGILFDHRSAPPETDMADRESLHRGLRVAYGDSAADDRGCAIHTPPCRGAGWVDLERVIADIWDPATDPADARRFFLNQMDAAEDAWLSEQEWAARADAAVVVPDGAPVALGFDGSLGDDATALIGCELSSGHLFTLGVWEAPESAKDWRVPQLEVDAAVARAFDRFNVCLMFADPPHWQDWLLRWQQEYGDTVVREWWTNRARAMVSALERFHTAVVTGELSHDGDARVARHVLNARRRISRSGVSIAKDAPHSPRKIDAAVAAALAYEARAEAVAAGLPIVEKQRTGRVVGW